MLKTLIATVRKGKIKLSDRLELPEGTKVLVTVLPNEETEFWNMCSSTDCLTQVPESIDIWLQKRKGRVFMGS